MISRLYSEWVRYRLLRTIGIVLIVRLIILIGGDYPILVLLWAVLALLLSLTTLLRVGLYILVFKDSSIVEENYFER